MDQQFHFQVYIPWLLRLSHMWIPTPLPFTFSLFCAQLCSASAAAFMDGAPPCITVTTDVSLFRSCSCLVCSTRGNVCNQCSVYKLSFFLLFLLFVVTCIHYWCTCWYMNSRWVCVCVCVCVCMYVCVCFCVCVGWVLQVISQRVTVWSLQCVEFRNLHKYSDVRTCTNCFCLHAAGNVVHLFSNGNVSNKMFISYLYKVCSQPQTSLFSSRMYLLTMLFLCPFCFTGESPLLVFVKFQSADCEEQICDVFINGCLHS